MLATTDEKSLFPQTHRGHLSRIGGVRRRLPGAVHDGLESLSTFAGIRNIEAARKTALVPGPTPRALLGITSIPQWRIRRASVSTPSRRPKNWPSFKRSRCSGACPWEKGMANRAILSTCTRVLSVSDYRRISHATIEITALNSNIVVIGKKNLKPGR